MHFVTFGSSGSDCEKERAVRTCVRGQGSCFQGKRYQRDLRFFTQPAMRAHVVLEGVELHEGCTLSTLRAACTALGIGKSGGTATVLQRIHNFMDRQRLLERHQVEDARVQLPREQAPVSEPTPEEMRRHALSHIPFMPWCEHCIKFQPVLTAMSKQDQMLGRVV